MLIGTDPGIEILRPESLLEALEGGATVVTATRRLARRVAADYAATRSGPSWPTPDVLPWGAWLARAYRDLRDHGVLAESRPVLDEGQAAVLWESVLAEDEGTRGLLMPSGAVAECRDAWALVHDWELDPGELAARGSEDCRRFAALAQAYRRRLDAAGLVDGAVLPAVVTTHADGLPEARVVFHGFERLPPAHRRLMTALGGRAALATQALSPGDARVLAFPDPDSELDAAVAWAREKLAANPRARIGIVVPDLGGRTGRLEHLLDEALAPQRLLPDSLDGPRPWNLSLGRPLAEAPVVAAALTALAAGTGELDAATLGRLLRSPFIAGAETEAAARALLDAWLRSHGGETVPSGRLAGWARRGVAGAACPAFAEGLAALLDALWGPPRRRPASAWAEAFTLGLRAVGWPGDAPLASDEYQGTSAWAELLDALARLDPVLAPMHLSEAIGRLRRMAGERVFQPESGDAPVQVMGLLETPGQVFDALWVTRLHDGVLPAPLKPCPLIPVAVQREREMPRASPACELALARAWIRRLAGSAPEVVFSWPRRQDEEPLRMSPVLGELPCGEGAVAPVAKAAATQLAAARTEQVPDDAGVPAAGRLRGGTGLLRAQAACPFQAYARYRLRCEPLDQPAPGMDPMSRGTVLHDALQRVWRRIGDQASLARLDAADRRRLAETAVGEAIEAYAEGRDLPLPKVVLELETAQAAARVGEFLEQDLARTPFKVSRTEAQVELTVGPLVLRGRVDRVDEVPGGYAVIDYKGGMARRSDWYGERPKEPQLPVYAINLPDVAAVAFGCLKPGDVGYQGLARDDAAMGTVKPAKKDHGEAEWRQLLAGWGEVTTALAEAVAAGDARVDPRNRGRTSEWRRICEQCGLQAVCRRDELLGGGGDSEAPDD